MAGAAPQQSGGNDNSSGIIWGIAAIFATIGMIWYAFKSYIVYFYLLLKLYEVDFLSLFNAVYFAPLRGAIEKAMINPSIVKFPELVALGQGAGDILRFPFVIILFILAFVVYLGNTTRVFRKIYSMKEFAKLEQTNWPQISPTVNLDLLKVDIDKGPWAMALTPMQFCKRYKLLEEVRPQRREGMQRREWDRVDIVLKRGEANKLFALQLGAMWQDVKYLPLHTKALFAIFAARINADSKAAAKILAQLSATSTSKLDFSGVEELLNKHVNTKLVQQITSSHAYVLTVMASMLERARDDGVQACADFLWLKPLDRRLWYTLNTVGRQTPFAEVAGIYGHWISEKEAGRRILVPMVEEATKALELALKEVVYRPDE
ncbi:MAG: type IVB secretion system coupling complex protein DotM/IcmP [Gammaproteobacteria bacterium]|nr:type IVB secretion system coupling complex protein DotM/IcmP [Gammaproteobacteria bacterium]